MQNQLQETTRKSFLTRRDCLKYGILTGLGGLLCLQIWHRQGKNRLVVGLPQHEEAKITVALKEYKRVPDNVMFSPSESAIDMSDCRAKLKSIQISKITFTHLNSCDKMHATVALIGEKNPKKRFFATLMCYDEAGCIIGRTRMTVPFKDRRCFPDENRVMKMGMWETVPLPETEQLSCSLDDGKYLTDIAYIGVSTKTWITGDDEDE